VNLLEDNVDTVNKNTETVTEGTKQVGLEVNVEKTEYMLLLHHHNAGPNRDIKLEIRSFENVTQFKYLGTIITNQNVIKRKLR
jgi:hypothetical protein